MKITKSLLLFGFVFLLSVAGKAQTASRFYENGKVGYRTPTGVVVPAKYSAGSEMTANGAVVTLNGKSGFINAKGKEITPLIYDEAFEFKNGRAAVKSGANYFFIDMAGKKVADASATEIDALRRSSNNSDPTLQ